MEDSKIIDLYWQRSEQAISETSDKYGMYCHTIAYNILMNREDSEDTVNDTYLAAWNSMPPYRPSILKTFLGKITRNLALKRYRDNARIKRGGQTVTEAIEELESLLMSEQSTEGEVIAKELEKAMNRFVSGLPDLERNIFLRRYWYLESIEMICRHYEFTESKVKSILYRTRGKLRSYLQKGEYL